MGDRTGLALAIFEVSPDEAREVWEILEQYELGNDWSLTWPRSPLPHEIRVGRLDEYNASEMSLGSAGEIANLLVEKAPSCVFSIYEDPYDYLGDLYIHVPSLGLWNADCSIGGEPAYTREQIKKAIADDMVDTLLGDAWFTVLDAYFPNPGEDDEREPIKFAVAEAMYARLTKDGTACAETALCDQHLDRAGEFLSEDRVEPGVTAHVDCSGNEMLSCQVCGARV